MPRYYFHVYDDYTALDDEGIDLPDVEAARREALVGARALAAEQVTKGKLTLHHRIEVEDEDRRPVLTHKRDSQRGGFLIQALHEPI